MKTLLILLLLVSPVHAEQFLSHGEVIDMWVPGEDWGLLNGDFQALTSIVRGTVRDQYGNKVDDGIIRSNGVCVTKVTRGEYLCSEIYGSWTFRFTASGYSSKIFSVNVDSEIERKDIKVKCDDSDYDGVCNIDDNCPHVPNGPRSGICKQKEGECSVFVKTCDRDRCGCDCLLNQEVDPCWCE